VTNERIPSGTLSVSGGGAQAGGRQGGGRAGAASGRRRRGRGARGVQVVPLTSNVGRLYPSEAYVLLNGEQRKAVADQLTTASKQRLIQKAGELSVADIEAVERAIRVQLRLS
jgi:mRNA-degrading endonuclease toxin of MazEF toxin-antitoxin module